MDLDVCRTNLFIRMASESSKKPRACLNKWQSKLPAILICKKRSSNFQRLLLNYLELNSGIAMKTEISLLFCSLFMKRVSVKRNLFGHLESSDTIKVRTVCPDSMIVVIPEPQNSRLKSK